MCHISKPTHTDQFMWSGSHHPLKHKLYIIRTLHHKANNVLTSAISRSKLIKNALKACGYAERAKMLKAKMSSNNTQKQKHRCMFSRRQIKSALNGFSFWSIGEHHWIFCNSCKWVPQLSSVWKYGSQNHTVIVGKGSNTQNSCKLKNLWELKDFSEEQQDV